MRLMIELSIVPSSNFVIEPVVALALVLVMEAVDDSVDRELEFGILCSSSLSPSPVANVTDVLALADLSPPSISSSSTGVHFVSLSAAVEGRK